MLEVKVQHAGETVPRETIEEVREPHRPPNS